MESKDILLNHTRLFYCPRCWTQVFICGQCDHGQLYCSSPCRDAARQDSARAARRRYRHTKRGRELQAKRQASWRRRRSAERSRVPSPPVGGITKPTSTTGGDIASARYTNTTSRPALAAQCSQCLRQTSGFVRQDDSPPRKRKPRTLRDRSLNKRSMIRYVSRGARAPAGHCGIFPTKMRTTDDVCAVPGQISTFPDGH